MSKRQKVEFSVEVPLSARPSSHTFEGEAMQIDTMTTNEGRSVSFEEFDYELFAVYDQGCKDPDFLRNLKRDEHDLQTEFGELLRGTYLRSKSDQSDLIL